MIRSLLVANRGEIAVRVIRAAREMGIRTVAVFSEADQASLHVSMADAAEPIGPPEPEASYLNATRIVEVAKRTGCDAVHPGYGFLSERAEFAEACEKAGLIFVGPPASAMRLLGAKIEAKRLAVGAGVPITPGYFELGASPKALREAADRIGYPVVLKASAGGGGRGMRILRHASEFDHALRLASEEAESAFGDGQMMVEKLIDRPRHLETQVLADRHGHVACLFERECSLQRRHQKLLEESPSPAMTADLWERMRAAAAALVSASGYVGAGTVEFMLDEATGELYFLEVNARLQVEHPVTEMVVGEDLVQWQLRIASGECLDLDPALLDGDRAALSGHAIEARIVAEDPAHGFLPSSGKILAWAEPKGPGLRVDTGFGAAATVSRYYDSLLAKVIAHAPNRPSAIDRLRQALLDFHILGVRSNIGYVLDVLDHPDFRAGRFDTGFLEREFDGWTGARAVPPELGAVSDQPLAQSGVSAAPQLTDGAWGRADGFRNTSA